LSSCVPEFLGLPKFLDFLILLTSHFLFKSPYRARGYGASGGFADAVKGTGRDPKLRIAVVLFHRSKTYGIRRICSGEIGAGQAVGIFAAFAAFFAVFVKSLVDFERFGSFELALVEQDIPLTMHTATDIDAG